MRSLSIFCAKQIFTNADKVHARKVLRKLGLEDCFEGIICFETLNPTHKNTVSDDEDDIEFVGSVVTPSTTNGSYTTTTSAPEIFDIVGHFAQPNPNSVLPKTPIVCKPSEAAIERALKIANINPQRTVSNSFQDSKVLILRVYYWCSNLLTMS
jgi:putative hydrolase of the HAD superfamily